jgi:hypothetical protein
LSACAADTNGIANMNTATIRDLTMLFFLSRR